MSFRYLALSLLMALPSILVADPDGYINPIDWTPDSEALDSSVQISGTFVAGAVFDEAQILDERPSLRAYVPSSLAGEEICMRAGSLDGSYEAQYRYTLPEPSDWRQGGVIDFGYETKHGNLLSELTTPDFAVALSVGACSSDPDTYLVGYWNVADADSRLPVRLLINSLGAREAYIYVGSDPSVPAIDCTSLRRDQSATDRRSFDFSCVISPDVLDDARSMIEINTATAGVTDPPRFIELVLPEER
ncbi:hypothetical protein [uncultured Jannaschia sp.]|uniref:hypothetical protein n=1 Tax=uncultured Jannaschia sp. TaxID=293347 RepID=UPI002604F711|nr:hypothetical protein [uncultured Jannaschia sp.]